MIRKTGLKMRLKNIRFGLIVGLIGLLLCACASDPKTGETGAQSSQGTDQNTVSGQEEDPVVLRIYDKNVHDEAFDDEVAQTIMEKTGVRIEIVNAADDPEEELDLMLSNRSYPDIILMEQGEQVNRYIEAGAFIPLDQLVEEYGPDIQEMYGSVLNRSRYTDGKLYWFANWYGPDYDASAGVLIRKDLLTLIAGEERANSSAPFTLSEYTELLEKFKEQVPALESHESIALELNSDAETYVMTMRGIFGMKTYELQNDGSLLYSPETEDYKGALLWLNQLYREGLLDKEWVINKTERWEQKLSEGYVFSTWCSYWDTDDVNAVLKEKYGDDAQFYCYKVVADDLSPDQTTYNGRNSLGWDAIGITDNCQNPEAAVRVLNYLASEEGQYLLLWGPEGKTWTEEDGAHVPDETFLTNWENHSEVMEQQTGVRRWTWMIKNGVGTDGTPYDLTTKYAASDLAQFANASIADTDYWDTAEFSSLDPTAQSDIGIKWVKVQDLYDQYYGDIICSAYENDAEYLYGKMLEEMERAGLSECDEYITQQYHTRKVMWDMG